MKNISKFGKVIILVMAAFVGSLVNSLPIFTLLSTRVGALSLPDVFDGQYRGQGQPAELLDGPTAIIPRAINLMLFIVGILAVFMLIFGGIRYVISGGDSKRVGDAKNTILYAILGLVVAILGYAIVSWVVGVVGYGAGGSSI